MLGVIEGGPQNDMTRLEPSGDVRGQFWRIAPAGGGRYRMSNLDRGSSLCLDIHNGGPLNNQPHLAQCGNVSGQLWALGEEGGNVKLIGVIGKSEGQTTLPEYRNLDRDNPLPNGQRWNSRARGIGATDKIPMVSGSEENHLCLANDRYRGESPCEQLRRRQFRASVVRVYPIGEYGST